MDVVVWLRSLGLEKYEAAFRENEIDDTVLAGLTHETLKELGVTAVGHRLKILDAIATLKNDVGGESPSTFGNIPAADRAERRQVTVMFADLVGSTAMSTRMDPEDLREILMAYQKAVAETVQGFGGFVAKYMGDGVLVYFGYPEAHEDDAERAVRAGLKLVAAVGALRSDTTMQTRIGVATGLVVVGDLIGTGASQEQAVVGETPNLAARLQSIAGPDSVLVAESTRRLVGNLFELQDLGPQELKGIKGPVKAWAALRPSSVESRFDALHASGLTELVGREEELELLTRRWSKAKRGDGQVVLLSGEPGIGKSRLTAALLERLVGEPHTRLRYFCSPQHTDSALYPIISQMERAAGFAHDDTAQAKLDKLDALLAQSFTPHQDAALLVEMLSLPNDGRYPRLDLTPPQRRQKTFEALGSQIVSLAEQHTVLLIFEDVHWIDPSSLEALGRGIDRIKSVGGLLIITHRPEFDPPWAGRSHVTALSLNRLAELEIGAMIDRVVGNKAIPASVRRDIIERTDGIPLFVEEMTRAVLDAENEGDARRTASIVPSFEMAVPASLHASLMARLDRLGQAKEVAQIAASLGREFSYPLLAAVVDKPELELRALLDRLVAAGLLFRQGVPPQATYLFKHALVQDAAYGTLLRDTRRALHVRIAETLERQFGEIAENQPEVIARHFTEAGLTAKAARLWGKAGQRSLARSALIEAAGQLTRALDQIAALPATPELRRDQIKLQVALLNPLMHTKGFAAPETKAAIERAHLLIEQAEARGEPPEDPLLLFSVLYGIVIANSVALKGDVMRELAAQFLALAEKQGATAPLVIGHRLVGASLALTGDVVESRAHYDRALALYDPAEHRPLVTQFGQDVGVAALSYRSFALWMLGHPEAALKDAEDAVKSAGEIGQAATSMLALSLASVTHSLCGNYANAIERVDEVIPLADEKAAMFWKVQASLARGLALALSDRGGAAVQVLTSNIAAFRAAGATVWLPMWLSYLGSAHAQLGEYDDARRCISDAMTVMEATGEKWFEPEANRLAGQIALLSQLPDATKAEAHFERALAVSRQQHAKSWELRAAISLAGLWRDQGKTHEARELLASVYGWFTEGFDTGDLKEARALLDEWAA
jgi:class 3 adenylate cyclase/predicted ATPase